MVTLKEIASLAGVSKSTVSRYLNNGSVSIETGQKIQKIIDETGYVPNQYTQNLKVQRSNMIGVVIPRFDSPSTNQILKGIDDLAYEKDYQLILTHSNLTTQREKENISLLEQQKVAGIILIASFIDDEFKKQIMNLNVPILIVGQQIEQVPSLIQQDYEAGRKIATLALELGHRKLLYVGVTADNNAVGVLRKKGFMDAANKAGVKVDFFETSYSRKKAYKQAIEYLPYTKATYIAAATDHIAIGIASAAHDLNLSIPDDFSLSGFGGYSESDYVYPRITTIDYPFFDLGQKAFQLIERLMRGEAVDYLTEMPNELIIKESTNRRRFIIRRS